jgi:arsenite transporter
MSIFERYLTLWVALCIVAGVALGHVMPGFFGVVAGAEVAKVNLPVALLIWLMIVDAAQDRLLLTRTGP